MYDLTLCFLLEFAGLEDADDVWRSMTLGFEPPLKYVPERYVAGIIPVNPDIWEAVPEVICQTVSTCLGPDVPIDPQIAFRYFKNGRLPEFVVAYFMWMQKAPARTAKSTIFGRALHYLEAFRQYMLEAAGALNASAFEDDDEAMLQQKLKDEEEENQALLAASDPAIAGVGPTTGEADVTVEPDQLAASDPAIAGVGPTIGEAEGPGAPDPLADESKKAEDESKKKKDDEDKS